MMLGPLEQAIWLHLSSKFPEHGAALAAAVGGAVLTAAKPGKSGEKPLRYAQARDLAKSDVPTMLQHHGVDAAAPALWPADEAWLEAQADMALFTTPVAYLDDPRGDGRPALPALIKVVNRSLKAAARADGTRTRIAVFGLHYQWLRSGAREDVIAALRTLDAPIGVMLYKARDPLSNVRYIEGLVDLVSSLPSVAVLRCDYGALGAFAFGAAGGSIGLNPGGRHFVPDGGYANADLDDPTPRVFVRPLMTYHKGSRLAAYEGDSNFDCIDDSVCHGRPLSRFQDERLRAEADAHSVLSWALMARQLANLTGTARQDEWIRWCRTASANLDYLDDHNNIVENPSAQLRAWLQFVGVPVP